MAPLEKAPGRQLPCVMWQGSCDFVCLRSSIPVDAVREMAMQRPRHSEQQGFLKSIDSWMDGVLRAQMHGLVD